MANLDKCSYAKEMKKGILFFYLLFTLPAAAVTAPTIAVGDFLFIRAIIVGCGVEVRTVEYGEVDKKGKVLLFGDISLTVEGKAIHHVVEELVDKLELRTGYRSRTIEIQRIPNYDEEAIAKRLMLFAIEKTRTCPKNNRLDEFPVWKFDYQIAQNETHDKTFKYALSGPDAAALRRLI